LTKGIDLRELDDIDLMILERYHVRERKVLLLSSIFNSPHTSEPKDVLDMLKAEIFPELGIKSNEFVKDAENIFDVLSREGKVIRLSRNEDGSASAREQAIDEIDNIDEIVMANRGRRRR
jgi:hypothetical protein